MLSTTPKIIDQSFYTFCSWMLELRWHDIPSWEQTSLVENHRCHPCVPSMPQAGLAMLIGNVMLTSTAAGFRAPAVDASSSRRWRSRRDSGDSPRSTCRATLPEVTLHTRARLVGVSAQRANWPTHFLIRRGGWGGASGTFAVPTAACEAFPQDQPSGTRWQARPNADIETSP